MDSALRCPHEATTEPDAEGRAICLRCLAVVQVILTRDVFDQFVEQLRG